MSGITKIFNSFSKHVRDKQESTHGVLNCEMVGMAIMIDVAIQWGFKGCGG